MKQNEKLKIQHIPVASLTFNSWNSNRMGREMEERLKTYIKKEGMIQTLLVRPKGKDKFEVVDGAHRLNVAKELGYQNVPCIVLNLDDRQARIASLNLNELKGQPVPNLLAEIIHDLSKEASLDDLSKILPYSREELDDCLELLRLPLADLEKALEKDAQKQEEMMPTIISIVLDREQNAVFEQALEKAFQKIGMKRNRKASAITMMAKSFLEKE